MKTLSSPETIISRRWLAGLAVLMFTASGCFQEKSKPSTGKAAQVATRLPDGLLEKVASARGLTDEQVIAAAKTYVPTGGKEPYLGLLSTGSSGRLAVFSLPSMRILKYIGVFSREPWQGYAFDDESKELLAQSARDEIAYGYGDSGAPALSMTAGLYDGQAVFLIDGANARIAVIDLEDYETKQILSNPVFRSSHGDAAVTTDGEYLLQTVASPEIPGGKWVDPASDLRKTLRGGITLWRVVKAQAGRHAHIEPAQSFTVELPPYLQGRTLAGKGVTEGFAFTIGACAGAGVVPGEGNCVKPEGQSVLHVLSWRDASAAQGRTAKINGHEVVNLSQLAKDGLLKQIALGAGAETVALSPDGGVAAVTYRFGEKIDLIDLKKAIGMAGVNPDTFAVPTITRESVLLGQVELGGPSVDALFAGDGKLYVTVREPGMLVRVDVASLGVTASHALGFEGGQLAIPGGGTKEPEANFAIVMNKRPHGKFVSVGPSNGLHAHLIDISGETMQPMYDMSVPQANNLSAVVHKSGLNHTVFRYKVGTDTRTGQLSPYGTLPGQERIERKGKRVQVFGTLIRSHITPEIVEVEEGDTVTFHFTNLEQAQDQTHGFTVDTYDVHGSWEPGKTASVTFVADRPGVFPYYCTEFCSALHLEMQGYLLVKPKGYKASSDVAGTDAASSGDAKAAYEKKLQSIQDTQAVLDSVVKWLQAHDYTSNDRAKQAAEDALEQLEHAKEIQPKIDAAAQKGDYDNAFLWAEQYFQYQVKGADAGLRAKKILTEGGAK